MTWAATGDLTDGFFKELVAVCRRLGCKAEDVLRVMMSESGVKASAHNPSGDASGLIQFMPKTMQGLGWSAGPDAFRKMPALEQLKFVEKYYMQYKGLGLDSPARLYLFTFLPALGGIDESRKPSFVLCGSKGPFAWAYSANRVFDKDQKGFITLNDLGMACDRAAKGARWNELVIRLAEAQKPTPVAEFKSWAEAQQELANMGLYVGKVDGLPGPLTLAAIGRLRQLVKP
jgi:hypothetical protein